MKPQHQNIYRELDALSLAQYEEKMSENLSEKEPLLSLKAFSDEFARTAAEYNIHVSIGPNLQILSLETADMDGVLLLIEALDTVYEELMLTATNVDVILPHIMLIEDYMRVLKSKLSLTKLRLN